MPTGNCAVREIICDGAAYHTRYRCTYMHKHSIILQLAVAACRNAEAYARLLISVSRSTSLYLEPLVRRAKHSTPPFAPHALNLAHFGFKTLFTLEGIIICKYAAYLVKV